MCIEPRNMLSLSVPNVILKHKVLKRVSKCTYLGVLITDNLKDNDDINRQLHAIYARGNVIIRRFSNCTDKVKIKLFNAYCRSLYCSQLWCNFNIASLKKLQCAYNHIFRMLMKLERDVSMSAKFVENNVDGIKAVWRKLIFGFRCCILNSSNDVITCIVNSLYFLSCCLNNRWIKELFTFS